MTFKPKIPLISSSEYPRSYNSIVRFSNFSGISIPSGQCQGGDGYSSLFQDPESRRKLYRPCDVIQTIPFFNNHIGELTMRITTLLGSAKKKGNTATVLGWAEEELKSLIVSIMENQ